MERSYRFSLVVAVCATLASPVLATEDVSTPLAATVTPTLTRPAPLSAVAGPQATVQQELDPCEEVPAFIAPHYYWQMRAIMRHGAGGPTPGCEVGDGVPARTPQRDNSPSITRTDS